MSSEDRLLESLLTLVTKPEMIEKNIKLLQDNINKHQKALDLAASAHEAADKRHDEAKRYEGELAKHKALLDDRESALNARQDVLSKAEAEIKGLRDEMAQKAKEHASYVAKLDADRKQFEVDIGRSRDEVQTLMARAGELQASLVSREAAVAAREQEADLSHKKIKSKLEKLKQLAE